MTHTIARSGGLPLQFKGELVAESTADVDEVRGFDLDLYRTQAGKYVVSVLYWSDWGGEPNFSWAAAVDDKSDVATWLAAIPCTSAVKGYPSGAQFEGRQTKLLNSLTTAYQEAVGELLSNAGLVEVVE